MIFAVQRYLEDHFSNRGLRDPNGYAVALANAFDAHRAGATSAAFLARMSRIRTAFFAANGIRDRRQFESRLLALLDKRFEKKKDGPAEALEFPGGLAAEARRIQRLPARRIGTVLEEFRHALEARAVDSFWVSRQKGLLIKRPERFAQALLEMFLKGVIGRRGFQLSQAQSGTGFVDVVVAFSNTPHVLELKVLNGARFRGPSQLATYMKHERRREGWLIVLDARSEGATALPGRVDTAAGVVRVLPVNINPVPPSRQED